MHQRRGKTFSPTARAISLYQTCYRGDTEAYPFPILPHGRKVVSSMALNGFYFHQMEVVEVVISVSFSFCFWTSG